MVDRYDDTFGFLRSFLAHRAYLAEAMSLVTAALDRRTVVHDLSKLKEDEFAGYVKIWEAELPNYWNTRTGAQLTFLDIIEMVCDWWAAQKAYGNSLTWMESVEKNLESKSQYLSKEQRWLAEQVARHLEGAR